MTCIIGYKTEKSILMIGDSCGTDDGHNYSIRQDRKVFIKKNILIGFTTSYRMGQLLMHTLDIPEYNPNTKSVFEYLCSNFVDAIRKCFKDNDIAKITDSVVKGGTFLIGFKGRLFQIYSDFQVEECVRSYNSCGSGYQYALGALGMLQDNISINPNDKLHIAIKIASNFNAAVKEPFYIEELKN